MPHGMRDGLDEKDKLIIRSIQGDLPLNPRPFLIISKKIGIGEEELIKRIKRLKEKGIIRRFGATLRHQEAGYPQNAMVAWNVPKDRIDYVGERMAQFKEVTHCYQRVRTKDWPYNLYTMIHGNSRKECRAIARRLSDATGIKDYLLLFSEKEFKKTSMEYF